MDLFITQLGVLAKSDDLKSNFNAAQINKLKKELTVTYIKYLGKKTTSKQSFLYRIISSTTQSWFAAPRFCCLRKILNQYNPNLKINYINNLHSGTDIIKSFLPGPDLYDYQQICYDYLAKNIYNNKNVKSGAASCIFVMDTGLGKTFLTMALIEKFRKKTLIILPSSSGLSDWIEVISKTFPSLKLGEYHSKKKQDGDIVIMMIRSALKEKFKFGSVEIDRYQYFKQFGFVIFDEVHDYAADENQNIFWHINASFSIGITATPDERSDNMDTVYYKHLGPIIKAIDIPNYGITPVKWKGFVKIIEYYGPDEYTGKITNSIGWTDTVATNKQLAADPYRTKLLINEIISLYNKSRYIFVFAEHRAVLDELEIKLINLNIPHIYSESQQNTSNVGVMKYMGGSTPQDKIKAEQEASIILTTYQFSRQSVSIKKMDSIVFASPRRNKMRQILGRITRMGGNVDIVRQIVDIVDIKTPIASQFDNREKIYDEKEFDKEFNEISYVNIKID